MFKCLIKCLKSAATSSLRKYTGSEIFASGISPRNRQIAFVTTLYKLRTIFRMRLIVNQLVEHVLRSRYAPPKTVRFGYRKISCPTGDVESLSKC